jgi:hypothetical protein
MQTLKLSLAVIATCTLMSAVSAQAFTYDNRTNQGPDGSAKFRDPESALSNGGSSNFSLKFSSSGMNGGQNGTDSRFVQSSNPAFSSPFGGPNNLDYALGNRH